MPASAPKRKEIARQQQPAELIPFPICRQHRAIDGVYRTALLDYKNIEDGEKYLRSFVERHRKKLKKLGIAEDRIAADVAELEAKFFGDGPEPEEKRLA
jgi:hypothetical protein